MTDFWKTIAQLSTILDNDLREPEGKAGVDKAEEEEDKAEEEEE